MLPRPNSEPKRAWLALANAEILIAGTALVAGSGGMLMKMPWWPRVNLVPLDYRDLIIVGDVKCGS